MMTRNEIVEALARKKVVEDMVARITGGPGASQLGANGKDLAQLVYEILLRYDEDKIVDLWEAGQIRFFIARIIKTQAFSSRSPFYYTFRRFGAKSEPLGENE